MIGDNKIVYYEKFCPNCANRQVYSVDEPCNECLSIPARPDSHMPEHYEPLKENYIPGMYTRMTKINDYLYETWYTDLDYEYAQHFFTSDADVPNFGMCSSVRSGCFYGRNYDWTYDDTVNFVVHCKRDNNNSHYAFMGIAGSISKLTKDFVAQNRKDDIYKLIPYMIQDGINEKRLACSVNVVPADKGLTTMTEPALFVTDRISALRLVQYILSYFETADEAVDHISQFVSLYFPKSLHNRNYELHYMVADPYKTYCLEIVDNRVKIIDITAKPYITNFFLHGVAYNNDGKVYTPATQTTSKNAQKTNHITPNGSGLERYNYIVDRYLQTSTKDRMRELMNELNYTRTYPSSPNPAQELWYTEFTGINGLTVSSPIDELSVIMLKADQLYLNRSRDDGGKTWQTVHSSVYDMGMLKLYLVCQEDGTEHVFEMKQ